MRRRQGNGRRLGWILAAAIAGSLAGCQRGSADRCPLDGAVTLDGKPVDGGSIQFEPLDARKTSASGALVRDGRYSIPSQAGLTPGKYCVRIYWSEKIDPSRMKPLAPGVRPSPGDIPSAKELIPAKYNSGSALTIEVRQGSVATFDFPLSTH
jgi:hypothetical protein